MTRYVITTGTSLSTNARCWTGIGKHGLPLEDIWALSNDRLAEKDEDGAIRTAICSRRKEVLGLLGGNPDEFAERAKVAAEQFELDCWTAPYFDALSAELATINEMARGSVIEGGDVLRVLVGTNAPDAHLLRAILARLVAQSSSAPELGLGLSNVTVELSPRTYSWDPTSTSGFKAQMDLLAGDLGQLEDWCFVLTGGYKAVLIDLAARLGAIGATTKIYYRHEAAQKNIRVVMTNGHVQEADYVGRAVK